MDPQPVSFEQELTQGLAVPATPAELPDPEDDLLLQLRQEREAQRLAARAAEQAQRQQAQKENLRKPSKPPCAALPAEPVSSTGWTRRCVRV